MNRPSPRLEIFPKRIEDNARSILELCHRHGVKVACVTKGAAAHPAVAKAYLEAGADLLADSHGQNLTRLRADGFPGPFLWLRLPAPSHAQEVVEQADMSLNSSLSTLKCLSEAAKTLQYLHKVIIMVDVGDLREGIWPDRAVDLVRSAKELPGLEIIGMGCNLACHGGVIPSIENMNLLIQTRDACRRETGLELPVLSGGNSSGLPLLASGSMPAAINHFRIGEAILLGKNVIDHIPWPGTRQDAFIAVGEAIEVETKPSIPIGVRGPDAFGRRQEFVDRGRRRRAICNIGRQDVAVDGVIPIDPGIVVLGGSSDHLVLDVEEARESVEVGSMIRFTLEYGALLALSTSDYVHKFVVEGE